MLNLTLALLDGIDVKATARAVAAGRIALGASYLLAPGLALRMWPGRPGSTPEDRAMARLLARSVGGRDVALGVGALLALAHDTPARGWVEAGMLADTVDALAIAVAFRRLPRGRALAMLAASVGTAAAGRWLAGRLG
jgi:hypothetical protein